MAPMAMAMATLRVPSSSSSHSTAPPPSRRPPPPLPPQHLPRYRLSPLPTSFPSFFLRSLTNFPARTFLRPRLLDADISRRQLAAGVLFSLHVALPPLPGLATDESQGQYVRYLDEDDKYTLLIPTDWIKGTGKATGSRNVTAFHPVDDVSANVNVLITGVGADYTSLGSFGPVEAFAENLINSLDRSWKKPPGQIARLVNCKSSGGLYYIEYTIQQPQEKKKHLLSVIGMRFNGWYNRLYTITGQYLEDDFAKYGSLVEKTVNSFKFA